MKDRVAVAGQSEQLPAPFRADVPDLGDPLIRAGRSQMRSIRTEGDATDPDGMTGQGEQLLACGTIPHFRRPILAACGHAGAVWAEVNTEDEAVVTFQGK